MRPIHHPKPDYMLWKPGDILKNNLRSNLQVIFNSYQQCSIICEDCISNGWSIIIGTDGEESRQCMGTNNEIYWRKVQ